VRVAIVSDTHGLLRPELLELLADVEHILHAGDIGSAEILAELEAIAPVTAVWGNTDGFDVRDRVPETARVELGGVRVAIIHGQQFRMLTPRAIAERFADADLAVHGHSHQPGIERVGGTLVVNPGSAGPRRFSLPVTAALATLAEGEVRVELVHLLEGGTR
jgi:uncharacterized protein